MWKVVGRADELYFYEIKYYCFHALANKEALVYANNVDALSFSSVV